MIREEHYKTMTDTEFFQQISTLDETASTLNKKAASINDLITTFEDKLRQTNLGLEVWLARYPISSRASYEENREGEPFETGTEDEELGFALLASGQWGLAVRTANYDNENTFKTADVTTCLRESNRKTQIEALKRFPLLVDQMNREAVEAVRTIDAAQNLAK